MNKIYKVVWSRAKNSYVVVSELAKNTTKGAQSKKLLATVIAAGVMGFGTAPIVSAADIVLPEGDYTNTIRAKNNTVENNVTVTSGKVANIKISNNTDSTTLRGIRAQSGGVNNVNLDKAGVVNVYVSSANGAAIGVEADKQGVTEYNTLNTIKNLEYITAIGSSGHQVTGIYGGDSSDTPNNDSNVINKIEGVKNITAIHNGDYVDPEGNSTYTAFGIRARHGSENIVTGNTETGMTISASGAAKAIGINARDENSVNNVSNIADSSVGENLQYAMNIKGEINTAYGMSARDGGTNNIYALKDENTGKYKSATMNVAGASSAVGIYAMLENSTNNVYGIGNTIVTVNNNGTTDNVTANGITAGSSSFLGGVNSVEAANDVSLIVSATGGASAKAYGIRAYGYLNSKGVITTAKSENTVTGYNSIEVTADNTAVGVFALGEKSKNDVTMALDENGTSTIKVVKTKDDSTSDDISAIGADHSGSNEVKDITNIIVSNNSNTSLASGIRAKNGSVNTVNGASAGLSLDIDSSGWGYGIYSNNGGKNVVKNISDTESANAIGVKVNQETPLTDQYSYARGIEANEGSNEVTVLQDATGNYKAASINVSFEGAGRVDATGIYSKGASNTVKGISNITVYANNVDSTQYSYAYGITSSGGTNEVIGANLAQIKVKAEGGNSSIANDIDANSGGTNVVSGFSSIEAEAGIQAYGIYNNNGNNDVTMALDENGTATIKAISTAEGVRTYAMAISSSRGNTVVNVFCKPLLEKIANFFGEFCISKMENIAKSLDRNASYIFGTFIHLIPNDVPNC